MSDFISRNALIEDLKWLKTVVNESSKNEVQDFIDRVETFPKADVVEVVHGKWINDAPWIYGFECSECGKWILPEGTNGEMNYCPNCGVDMR